jgi:hypothetical protein
MEGKVVMKNIYFSIVLIFSMACSNPSTWVDTLPKPWTLSHDEMSQILPQFHQKFPDFHQRIKAINLWRVGTPYGIFKLGEEIAPDLDPIIRVDTSDCTVHVLTTVAFSLSHNWKEAKEQMIQLHYKDQKPSFKSRWHYTSDRLMNHPVTVNITRKLLPESELASIELILNQKENGSQFLDLDWTDKRIVYYIPSEKITLDLLQRIPELAGVAFVRKSYFKMGIVLAHEGYLLDKSRLVHASSEAGKTVNVDFMSYYFREDGALFDGIMVSKFVEPTESK